MRRKPFEFVIIIIIIIINFLTARVVGAPQMILQPVFSIFSLFSTALWDLANFRPVHSLMLSSSASLVFFPRSLCLASQGAHLHMAGMLWPTFLTSLLTLVYSVLVTVSVFMALSTVFVSINSPDNSPLSHCSSGLFFSALLVHSTTYLFTIVRRSSCGPFACWILAQTSSLVTWSLYEMCSILQ